MADFRMVFISLLFLALIMLSLAVIIDFEKRPSKEQLNQKTKDLPTNSFSIHEPTSHT